MSLAPGTRIGAHEIQSPLGAGGMGEVYRARDTKLGREVAIKILPDNFVTDPARVARFQREAQALAALNHPHIAQIYGFEDSSEIQALVMELVEGPTLADRVAQGPIPLDEALPIARQLAEALEAAHEQGIIHRDLKPANIKVRPDGTVKVLDFGLAKLADADAAIPASMATQSPTITSPAVMTGAGMLLGTAAYMAPEQARGKTVDKRADIWAFGCVLYEMLTGRRAFGADEVSDTLAMVLMQEPDWSPLPGDTPPAIHTLLRRCLGKERKRRLPDIGVARLEIDEALAGSISPRRMEAAAPRARQRLGWISAAVAGLAAVSVGTLHFTERPPEPPPPIRFQVLPPSDATMPSNFFSQALSPDGRYIAFLVQATTGNAQMLALRAFHEGEARLLSGTQGAIFTTVFWSPDSRFIGFFADGKLKKIDIGGGPPQILCELPQATPGATWGLDGTILLGQSSGGLLRVSSGGGIPVPATMLDPTNNEFSHGHPWFLPDGRRFLYRATSGTGERRANVYVGSLDGTPAIPVGESDSKVVYANGFLLLVRDGTLLAQAFDTTRLETTGDPIVVAQDVPVNVTSRSGGFSASATGVLSYRSSSFGSAVISQLVWLNREGQVVGTVGEKMDQTNVRLAPDAKRVAVSVLDPARRSRDIWIQDLARENVRTRFTFDAGEDWSLAWSPDGRSLAFSGGREGRVLNLYQKPTDGSGAETLLLESADYVNRYVTSWSTDGRSILYHTGTARSQTAGDIWVLDTGSDSKPRALVQTSFNEGDGHFSTDGRWVAYVSNESGRNEVYVMPFLGSAGKWQISAAGGVQPRWRGDGKELYYLADNVMMAAAVDGTSSAIEVGAVRQLFEVSRRFQNYNSAAVSSGGFGAGHVYDVAPDGQRFLVSVVADDQAELPPITVVTNFTTTLR